MEEKTHSKGRLIFQVVFLLFLIVGSIAIIRHQKEAPYQHSQGFIFGTFYNIIYQYDKPLDEEILACLNDVDVALSMFNDTSVVSRINRNESMETTRMFRDVFEKSQKVSEATEGNFDVTVAPLVNLWGFGFKNDADSDSDYDYDTDDNDNENDNDNRKTVKPYNRKTDSDSAIDSIMHFVGYKKVRLQGNKIVKADKRLMLDCSAIAKGYGSDVVAKMLTSHGIDNFMVEIGGEIVSRGNNEARVPWKVGVTKPTDDTLNVKMELQTVLNVTNVNMATSGNYRNFYYKDGKKYAHTIDPKTGRPVLHTLLSATVFAEDCATADAYATSFMVMGLEKSKQFLEHHSELQAYFIYADEKGENAVWYSPWLKSKIVTGN